LEFFVSYNSKDKEVAGTVGRLLEKHGHTPFLAHDDIKPSEKWEQEILRHLDTCNALIAVIAPNFVGSDYANQEVGIIMGKEKLIIPLRLDDSEFPGFINSSQAISTSEDRLDGAVAKAIRTAEDKLKIAFVRPSNVTSPTELVDARLKQRNEPYWLVSVKPQGGHGMIPKTGLVDKWITDSTNLPVLMTWMQSRPTANGWTFISNGPRFAELTADCEFCYGTAMRSDETVWMQKGIQILSQMTSFVGRVMEKFDIKAPMPSYIYPVLKLGRAQGLTLSIEVVPNALGERHATDEEEVVVQQSVLLDDWRKNPKPFLERMVTQFCRSFGISLGEEYATILVASALKNT
jgi:hypothetical protein